MDENRENRKKVPRPSQREDQQLTQANSTTRDTRSPAQLNMTKQSTLQIFVVSSYIIHRTRDPTTSTSLQHGRAPASSMSATSVFFNLIDIGERRHIRSRADMCRSNPERRTNRTCPPHQASQVCSCRPPPPHPGQRPSSDERAIAAPHTTEAPTIQTTADQVCPSRTSPKQCFQQSKTAKDAPLPIRQDGSRFSPGEMIQSQKSDKSPQ